MRRHLALSIVAAVACGPNVEPPDDDEWMLGTLSEISDVEADNEGRNKLVLRDDGTGDYIHLKCNQDDVVGSFQWEPDGGDVLLTPLPGEEYFIDPTIAGSPARMRLSPPSGCSELGYREYVANVQYLASDPKYLTQQPFYRADPCSGGGSGSGDLEECPPSLECHDPITCPLYWCDDQEPERCSP